MIVSKDINPERDVYYLGGRVLELISSETKDELDFFDVFEKMNTNESVSINLFNLTLDWLFLIGAINKSDKGNIVKCF